MIGGLFVTQEINITFHTNILNVPIRDGYKPVATFYWPFVELTIIGMLGFGCIELSR